MLFRSVSQSRYGVFFVVYDIGEIVSCKGIVEGVENSNFLIEIFFGLFILMFYEKWVDFKDLLFFFGFMDYLVKVGCVVCSVFI